MLKSFIFTMMLLSVQIMSLAPTWAQTIPVADTAMKQTADTPAIAHYQTVIRKTPADYKAWFSLGVAQAKQRHLQEAIIAFRRVITLQPALAEPHNNLAVIYDELGKYQAAVDELETSLKLDPGYTTAYENIGDLYIKLAADAYQKALQNSNNSKELRLRYSRLLHIRDADAAPQALPDDSAVLAAVEAWRAAWSSRDMAAYFAAYAHDFNPGHRFDTLAAWKQYKQTVIGKRTFIHVVLEHIKAVHLSDGRFRVTFTQHFHSDAFDSNDQKELLFQQTPDGWKIEQETTQ